MLIGDIREAFPDCPERPAGGQIILWDRQERQKVMTVHGLYSQAICLEVIRRGPVGYPFTNMENWFNSIDNISLKSEGLKPTRKEYRK